VQQVLVWREAVHMDPVNFGASPIMSAAAALLAAASSLNNGCCEEPLGLMPPQTTSAPTVPLALATYGKDGASRKAPVPVMLMSGFNGSDVLSVLNQLLSGSSQRVCPGHSAAVPLRQARPRVDG